MIQGSPQRRTRAGRIWSGAAALTAAGALVLGMAGTTAAASPAAPSGGRDIDLDSRSDHPHRVQACAGIRNQSE